jgi:hypothetical protein
MVGAVAGGGVAGAADACAVAVTEGAAIVTKTRTAEIGRGTRIYSSGPSYTNDHSQDERGGFRGTMKRCTRAPHNIGPRTAKENRARMAH